jgi:shikimate kinase
LVATLRARLDRAGIAARPLLAGEEPTGRLAALLAARSPSYARAHLVIETDGRTPAEVTRVIAVALGCA